jgi:hypothetical protein
MSRPLLLMAMMLPPASFENGVRAGWMSVGWAFLSDTISVMNVPDSANPWRPRRETDWRR